jgi:hypothetical protein
LLRSKFLRLLAKIDFSNRFSKFLAIDPSLYLFSKRILQ